MKYLHKRNQTKEQLQIALISLIEKKRVENITISELVQAAKITRSTFYRYYDDKYQLLEEVEQDTINALFSASNLGGLTLDNSSDTVEQIIKEYQEQFISLHALLGPNGDRSFESKLERQMNQKFYYHSPSKNIETEITQLAMTTMWLRVLKFWIFNVDRVSPEVIKKVTVNLIKMVIGKNMTE